MLVCGAADWNGDFQSGIPPSGSLVPGIAGEVGGGPWRGQLFLFRCAMRWWLMLPPMVAPASPT
jgi:hypothetical protein